MIWRRRAALTFCVLLAGCAAQNPPDTPNVPHAVPFVCDLFSITVLDGHLLIEADVLRAWDLDNLTDRLRLELPPGVRLSCYLGAR